MNVATQGTPSAQPQSRTHRPLWPSTKATAHLELEEEDPNRTPRQLHHNIGSKASSDTLRAKSSTELLHSATSASSDSPSTASASTAMSDDRPETKTPEVEAPSVSRKFSLANKKKRQERLEQEREERRLKEEANEALRRKHGEYHPPGHGQGHIHTHRPQQHHNHHRLERSRSGNNLKIQHHQQGSQSRIRIVSPERRSITSHSPTPSSSSAHSSHHTGYGRGRSRPTTPIRDTGALSIPQSDLHLSDLKSLVPENISGHWSHDSDEEQDHVPRRERHRKSSRSKDHYRTESVDTDASSRTNNSSVVRFDLPPRELRMTRQPSRSTLSDDSHHPSESSQEHSDGSQDDDIEMGQVGRPNHHSWPLKNKSTTGIVTGLSPEFDGPSEARPHTSMSRYRSSPNPLVERYLSQSKTNLPAYSSISTTSGHRPNSRNHHHQRHYSYDRGRETPDDMNTTAMEAMRLKAGSRAGGTIRGSTTVGGSVDASSVHETEALAADEHNYLAPLPPFQQGPAYSKVPRRTFFKFCFGGCRWWVLMLWIIIPAGIIGAVAAFLLHRLMICVSIDPITVEPMVYAIDPIYIRSLSLEYQTQTKGTINIVDSPNANETRVLLKLQRQFYKMQERQDLTGFQIETLANGTARYVLNDVGNDHRVFYISSVLCSSSILTIEMPRAAADRPELSINAVVDQQDVYINLDDQTPRSASWRFKGISNHNLFVQSLNINALSISYTSNSRSNLTLASVIVRERLSVVSVHGDIQASVGFSSGADYPSSSTVNLNTLDGQVRLDMKAWNQTCTFLVNSPSVELIKAGYVVLPFGQAQGRGGSPNGAAVNVKGLVASTGANSVSGTYTPPQQEVPQTTTTRSNTVVPSPTTDMRTATITGTAVTLPVPEVTLLKSGVADDSPTLGAGGSPVPAQLMIQANKNVIILFP